MRKCIEHVCIYVLYICIVWMYVCYHSGVIPKRVVGPSTYIHSAHTDEVRLALHQWLRIIQSMYVCMYERVWAPEIGWPTGRKCHFRTGWSPYRYSSSESERQLSPSHLYVCMYVWEWICNLYYVIICISEYVCMYASPSSGSSHMNSMLRRVVFFILGVDGLVGATGSVKFWWPDETETHTNIHTNIHTYKKNTDTRSLWLLAKVTVPRRFPRTRTPSRPHWLPGFETDTWTQGEDLAVADNRVNQCMYGMYGWMNSSRASLWMWSSRAWQSAPATPLSNNLIYVCMAQKNLHT